MPRAYQLPYSDELAAMVEAARDQIRDGNAQQGTSTAVDAAADDRSAEEGEEASQSDSVRELAEQSRGSSPQNAGYDIRSLIQTDATVVEFSNLEGPSLPMKVAP